MDLPNKIIIALDESGDLGWSFDQPYRKGGSSRCLTLACVEYTAETKKHLPRFVRSLYQRFSWDTSKEKKWAEMSGMEREYFATEAVKLTEKYPEIKYSAITCYKPNVMAHIRDDANKLYNYMLGLSELHNWKDYETIHLIPDPRSIKVKSGNSMGDYLQTKVWFDKKSKAKLVVAPQDSSKCYSIQVADMLAGLVQAHFEDGNSKAWKNTSGKIRHKKLYFD
ncbi:MAG: DUF3800 domain-containing protein [Pseudomonadales bacterium]|nr:DUF3800 domain-containing protein [Pseudomonadales bacterium]